MLVGVDGVFFDQRYAGVRNPVGRPLFSCHEKPLAVPEAAGMLRHAARLLEERGFAILVWDAWRPFEAQEALWDAFPDERFVARPSRGPDGIPSGFGDHQRGCAFDVTLALLDGMELPMPTDFDDFLSPKASPCFEGAGPEFVRRDLLLDAMKVSGFVVSDHEWWHFSIPGSSGYPPVLSV